MGKVRFCEVESPCSAFPTSSLIGLAIAGFLAIMTETLPAGLLPQIAVDLHISNALAGQLVTFYAAGSLVAAIPFTAAVRGWNRRTVLLCCLAGNFICNALTAFSGSIILTLTVRFVAGCFAGLAWGILPGYAQRMTDEGRRGRSVAVAMAGTPLAFSLGVPAGTFFAHFAGWRNTFAAMSAISAAAMLYALVRVRDVSGTADEAKGALQRSLGNIEVRLVLIVVFLWMTAHNVLYTYIITMLKTSGLSSEIATYLLVFGICSVAGIFVAGLLVDRMLRPLTIASIGIFLFVCLAFGVAPESSSSAWVCCVLWGFTFGGAATFLQTACSDAAKEDADLAPSLVTTSWNLAIACGGALGGGMIRVHAEQKMAWVCAAIVLGALAASTNKLALPATQRSTTKGGQ